MRLARSKLWASVHAGADGKRAARMRTILGHRAVKTPSQPTFLDTLAAARPPNRAKGRRRGHHPTPLLVSVAARRGDYYPEPARLASRPLKCPNRLCLLPKELGHSPVSNGDPHSARIRAASASAPPSDDALERYAIKTTRNAVSLKASSLPGLKRSRTNSRQTMRGKWRPECR